MLESKKTGFWRNRHEISSDGAPIGIWDRSMWRGGGSFELAGRRYDVKSNAWGTRFTMTDEDGAVVAEANRVGRRRWSVEADGRTYSFERASWWRSDQALVVDGLRMGSIRRASVWSGGAVADLPGLPLPIQVFVLVVVLTMWEAQAAAASGA